jgi:uncharacterized protein (DUF111 family)
MLLAALVDLGFPIAELERVVAALGLADEVRLSAQRVADAPLAATRLEVRTTERRRRQFGAMRDAIRGSTALAPSVRSASEATLTRLAEVEARLHGVPIAQLHLHEISGADTLVDIVGFHAGCASLGIDRLESSEVNVGGGRVTFSHGTFAVPAPATAELMRGLPTFGDSEVNVELLTPTGAAIIATTAVRFGAPPRMRVERIGYAVGSRVLPRPRVLRLLVGAVEPPAAVPS